MGILEIRWALTSKDPPSPGFLVKSQAPQLCIQGSKPVCKPGRCFFVLWQLTSVPMTFPEEKVPRRPKRRTPPRSRGSGARSGGALASPRNRPMSGPTVAFCLTKRGPNFGSNPFLESTDPRLAEIGVRISARCFAGGKVTKLVWGWMPFTNV